MLGICMNAFSQYRVVNTEQQQQRTNTAVEEYDSTYNFGIRAHNKKLPTVGKEEYYQRFIGQEIIFYKRANSTIERPTFYSNFRTTTPYAVKDTIWKKRRPVPKPKDYKVVDLTTDFYKAEHTDKGRIACCGTSGFILDGLDFVEERGNYQSGFFTPYTAIEGKTFKIANIRRGKNPDKNVWRNYLIFTLVDDQGQRLFWYTDYYDYTNDPIYPFVVKGFLEKMRDSYVGKEIFHFGHYDRYGNERTNKDIIRYKVKELIFAECDSSYCIPAFLVENYYTGKKATIALCQTPELFSTCNYDKDEIKKTFHGIKPNPVFYDDILSTMIIEEGSIYLKNLEKEKERHLALMDKYGPKFGDAIFNKEVCLGMTSKMVVESLGYPNKINTTKGSYGVHQQWCYEYSKRYLYFENGVLTDIQEF